MNGLLKTLIKPDWDDNPKRTEILHAANLIQIGEFQLIQLAYKAWYNKDLPEDKINKIFSEYLIIKNIMFMITNLEIIFLVTNKEENVEFFMQLLLQLYL